MDEDERYFIYSTGSQQIVIVIHAVNNIFAHKSFTNECEIEKKNRMKEKKLNVKMCSRCL